MTREQGWWMARECRALGSLMPSVWVHSATALPSVREDNSHFQVAPAPTPNSLSSDSPLSSALSFPYVSPALGSAPRLIKQAPNAENSMFILFYFFTHLHNSLTSHARRWAFLFGFILLHLGEKREREKRRNHTNHPALEDVLGQTVGSGFLPEEKSAGVGGPHY